MTMINSHLANPSTPSVETAGVEAVSQSRSRLPAALIALLILFHTVANLIWLSQDGRTLYGDPGNHARVSLEIFDILRQPTLALPAQVFDSTSFWPPLPYLVSQPLYFLFGIATDVTVFTTTIFLAIAIACTYLLGRRLYGVAAGLTAAFMFSFYPIVFLLARTYYVDIALTALIAVTFFFLLRSEGFSMRRHALLFGVCLGLSALTKQAAAVFALGPVLAAVVAALLANGKVGWRELAAWRPGQPLAPHGADLARRLINMLLAALVAALVAAPWYVANVDVLKWQTSFFNTMAENQFGARPYWWYFAKLDDVLLLWPLLLFVVGLVIALRRPKRHWLPLVWFVSGSLILPLITRDLVRYMLPLMPAVALLSAQWIVDLRRVSLRRVLLVITALFQVTTFFLMSWGAPGAWGQALRVPVQNDFHPLASNTTNRPQALDPLAFIYYQYPPSPHRWPVQSILNTLYSDIEQDGRTDEFSRLVPLSKILDFEFSTFSYEIELARRLGHAGARQVKVDDVSLQPDYLADFFDSEYVLFKSNNTGVRPNMTDIRDAWLAGDQALHDRFRVLKRWQLLDGSYAELLKRNGPPLAALSPPELQPIVRYLLAKTPDSRKAQRLQAQLAFGERTPQQLSAAIDLWQEEVRLRPNNLPAWGQLVDALIEAGRGEVALKLLEEAAQKPAIAPATTVELAIQKARVLDALGQTAAAEEANQQALRLAPESAAAQLAMAVFLIRHGQTDQANSYIEAAKRLAASPADVLVDLAAAYEQAGQVDQAVASLQEAIALAPKQRTAYARLAAIYRSNQQDAAAVEVLEQGAQVGALAAADYAALGDTYQALGKADQAQAVYQAAVDQFPGDPAGYLALGRHLMNAEDIAGAQAVFQAGLAAIPGDASLLDGLAQLAMQDPAAMATLGAALEQQGLEDAAAYLSLSQSQLQAGNPAGAEAILKQGIEQVAQPASLWLALGKLYADEKRVQEAEEAYRAAVRLSADNASTHLEQATFYETVARSLDVAAAEPYWTAARDAYQRALDLNPTLVRPYTGLALYFRVHKDQPAAIEVYKQGLERLPNEPWLSFGLAQTYNEAGDVESALPYYQKAIQLQPDNALFHAQLGNAHSRLKQWEQASAEYREALRLDPGYAEDVNLLTSLGLADLSRAQFATAAETFRQITAFDPQNQAAHYYLGQALEGAGDRDGARNAYQAAVDLAPTSEIGNKAAEKLRALGE